MYEKIRKKMNWFGAVDLDDVDYSEMTTTEAFWFGVKNGFKESLPYYLIIYSIIGFAGCIKNGGVVGIFKK